MATETLAIELVLKSGKFASEMAGVSKEFKDAERSLKEYGQKLRNIGLAFTAFGAAAVGAFSAISVKTINAADAMDKMSKRTGFSRQSLQELDYALKLSGSSIEAFNALARTMQRNLGGVSSDSAEVKDALSAIGLTLQDLQGLKPEEQFFKIASAISNIPDATTKAGIALNLFGRSGTDILPLLSEGADGLTALRAEAHKLGGVFSDELINVSVEVNDNFDRIKTTLKSVAATITTALLPTIKAITEYLIDFGVGLKNWTEAHPILTKNIVLTATALGSLALAIGGFLTLAGTIITIAPTFALAFSAMLGPVGLLTAAVTGLTLALSAYAGYVNNLNPNVMALEKANAQLALLEKRLAFMRENSSKFKADAIAQTETEISRQKDVVAQLQKTVDLQNEAKTAKVPSLNVKTSSTTAVPTADANIKEDKDYAARLAKIAQFSIAERKLWYETELAKTKDRLDLAQAGSDEYYALLSRITSQEQALYELNNYSFVDGWKNALGEVANAGLNWGETFKSILGSVQGALSDSFVTAFNSIGEGWQSFADGIVSIAKGLKDAVIKAFADMAAKWIVERTAMYIKDTLFSKAEIANAAAVGAARAAAASAWSLWGAIAIGAAIGAAIMAFAGAFADGGIVGGTSFTGDNVIARVNSGEMILTKEQQANLFAMINGRGSVGGGTANINQNITINGASDDIIGQITDAIKRGTFEGLELANASYKQGVKQNGYAV